MNGKKAGLNVAIFKRQMLEVSACLIRCKYMLNTTKKEKREERLIRKLKAKRIILFFLASSFKLHQPQDRRVI